METGVPCQRAQEVYDGYPGGDPLQGLMTGQLTMAHLSFPFLEIGWQESNCDTVSWFFAFALFQSYTSGSCLEYLPLVSGVDETLWFAVPEVA